ncbi:GA module-containing protein [Corynebacterium propinquum]|uniref:GA module-containing protein n=1 Tax=Corynebacterium propinquum TaxID=43769 RepID=UPI0003743844|nr:GA module-containing protein [Corynebacterium propinquum]QQU86945.1 GA module-containing protein [Corynebacterium propinquum]QQU90937.1 GA module-containing protein [Corynebacterium propinquum]WKS45282.1 GA module-containing protein [Corynebacterium propinquum]
MKLNKRTVAVAALSVSLVAPTISPVSHAQEKYLNCEQDFKKGADFDTDLVEAHLEEYLTRACGLTSEQIASVSQNELNRLAEKLGYQSQIVDRSRLVAIASATAGPSEAQPKLNVVELSINEVKEGDRTITGGVFLAPGQKEQAISAIFVKRAYPQNLTVSRDEASTGAWVPFSIPVHESITLHVGDEILVGPVPSAPESQKTVTVKEKTNGPTEKPDVNPIPPITNPIPGSEGEQTETEPKAPGAKGNGHLNCENKFQKGRDFNGVPSVIVFEHLSRNCGLTDDQIRGLSKEELRKVAEELKEPADKVSVRHIRAILAAADLAPAPVPKPEPHPAPAGVSEETRQAAFTELAAAEYLNPEQRKAFAKDIEDASDVERLQSIKQAIDAENSNPIGKLAPKDSLKPQAPKENTETENQDTEESSSALHALETVKKRAWDFVHTARKLNEKKKTSLKDRITLAKTIQEVEEIYAEAKELTGTSDHTPQGAGNSGSNNEDPTKEPKPNKESDKLDFEDNEVFSPNQAEWTAKDFVNPFKQHEKNEAGQELQETKRAASAALDGIQNLSDEHKAAYKGVIASATSIEQIELLVHGALETADSAVENGKAAGPFEIDENSLYSPNEKQWTSEDFLNSFKQHEKNEAAKVAEQTMLKDAKRQAHATIDGIKGLTEKHRTDFKAQIDASTNQQAVQRIVEVAQKASTTDADDAAENQPPKNSGNSGGTDNGNSTGERENTPGSSASNAKGIAAIAAGFGALGLAIVGILSAVNYFGGLNTIQAKVIDMLTSIGIRF